MLNKNIHFGALAVTLATFFLTQEALPAKRQRQAGDEFRALKSRHTSPTRTPGNTKNTVTTGTTGRTGTVDSARRGTRQDGFRHGDRGRGRREFVSGTTPVVVTGVVQPVVSVNVGASPIAEIIINQNEKCSICSNDYATDSRAGILPCKHYFHLKCITDLLTQYPNCPKCNATANTSNIREVNVITQP